VISDQSGINNYYPVFNRNLDLLILAPIRTTVLILTHKRSNALTLAVIYYIFLLLTSRVETDNPHDFLRIGSLDSFGSFNKPSLDFKFDKNMPSNTLI
jgi:hypothetical protein